MKLFITNSYTETQSLGARFANELIKKNVITLTGDLGSGKTTFIQGLAKELGIEKKIISPTYVIMRSYEIKSIKYTKFAKLFHHLDLYRLSDSSQIEELGIMDFLKVKSNLFAIEWPEKCQIYLPDKIIKLIFEYKDENIRNIIWEK